MPDNLSFSNILNVPRKWINIEAPDKALLILSFIFQFNDNGCNWSNGDIASFFNCSLATVKRHIHFLEEKKLIKIEKRKSKHRIIHIENGVDTGLDINLLDENLRLKNEPVDRLKNEPVGATTRARKILNKNLRTSLTGSWAGEDFLDAEQNKISNPNQNTETQKNKSTNKLQIDLHPVVQYWNNLHTSKIVRHTNTNTKTYKQIIKQIKLLQSGDFGIRNKKLKEFSIAHRIPISITRKKWSVREIEDVLSKVVNFDNRQSRISLLQVLYNPTHPNGLISLFLLLAHNPEGRYDSIDDVDPAITNKLKQIITDQKPNERELKNLYRVTGQIIDWFGKLKQHAKRDDIHNVEAKWCRSIRNPLQIVEMYQEFHDEERQGMTITSNALGPNSKSWNTFIDWWIDYNLPNYEFRIRL
jgi:hypothetical protein